MSTRGQRFLKISTTGVQTPNSSPVVGGPPVLVELPRSTGGKLLLGLALGALGGFALHNAITRTHAFRGARKDARRATTIARREYGRLASKFDG